MIDVNQERAEDSAPGRSLRKRALLAWRHELVWAYQAKEADRQTELRQVVFRKLVSMFGPRHVVEVEAQANAVDVEIWAAVEGLRFLGVRHPSGEIQICLVSRCPNCGQEAAGDWLTRLADLGRELADLEEKGKIEGHECLK